VEEDIFEMINVSVSFSLKPTTKRRYELFCCKSGILLSSDHAAGGHTAKIDWCDIDGLIEGLRQAKDKADELGIMHNQEPIQGLDDMIRKQQTVRR